MIYLENRKLTCPGCGRKVAYKSMDVSGNSARCPDCGGVLSLIGIIDSEAVGEAEELIRFPPGGAWIIRESSSLRFGVTARSRVLFFLIPFTLLWTGVSAAGFAASIIMRQHIGFIFLWLVCFLLSIVLIRKTVFAACGRYELVFSLEGVYLFTGNGKRGKKEYIDWQSVTDIFEYWKPPFDGDITHEIRILENRLIKISVSELTREKAAFLLLLLKYFRPMSLEEILRMETARADPVG